MLDRLFRQLVAILTAGLLLFSCASAIAEDPADPSDTFVDPTLPPDAIPWDSAHPDQLDQDMLYAHSAILIQADTGDVIFEKNADEIMYPASTTKILTAYIALQMADLENDVVTISQNAVDLVPPTYAKIPVSPGENVSMNDLIAATLVRSGNEGANAIAEYLSGDIASFADLMNETAQMLGVSSDTHFSNPSGAHDDQHYTTARDMSVIARAAMQDERFRDIVSRNTYEMPATAVHPQRTLVGGTSILDPASERYYYNRCIGVKTGFTNPAGYCFVGAAKRGSIELISVIFYSSRSGRWTDTIKLFEYGFSQLQSISPESLYAESPSVIDISGFALDDSNHGELTLGIRSTDDTRDMNIVGTPEKIQTLRENFSLVSSISWTRSFRAPINAGDVMGVLTYYSEDGSIAEYELIATRSIAARENAPPTLEQIVAYTQADENIWPRFSWDLLVPPAILLLLLILLIRFIQRHRRKRAKMPPIPKSTHIKIH